MPQARGVVVCTGLAAFGALAFGALALGTLALRAVALGTGALGAARTMVVTHGHDTWRNTLFEFFQFETQMFHRFSPPFCFGIGHWARAVHPPWRRARTRNRLSPGERLSTARSRIMRVK